MQDDTETVEVSDQQCAPIADMVRAQTLDISGDHHRAASIVARHLLSDGADGGAA